MKTSGGIYDAELKNFHSGHMQHCHYDSHYSGHGADFHSHADGGADDYADLCGNIGRDRPWGVPVLAGFSGGFQHFIGPTGGFLLSLPIMAYLIGTGTKLRKQKGMFLLFLILGTTVNYAVGVLMFCILMKASVWTGITACVLPFIPTAVIKAAAASFLGLKLQARLGAVLQWT